MAATFDYNTQQLERDFHFVEWDTKCKRSGLPCKAGSDRCQKCAHYDGSVHPSSFGVEYWQRFDKSYVLCKHEEAKDAEDSSAVRSAYYDFVKHRALCALCY